MKVALCFLAYGDEHINEFNELLKQILDYPIFVLTDNASKIIPHSNITIKETFEPFNFNLKRFAINDAFEYYDTILLLDTDVDIGDIDFVNDIKTDGMYVEWIDPLLTHKGIRLNSKNNEYCIELNKLNKNKLPIQFIPEYCVCIKISNINKRIKFIERWSELHNSIKKFEPTDGHYNLNGAIEGCIMYLACMDLDIPIIPYGKKMNITHYTSHSKFDKKLV